MCSILKFKSGNSKSRCPKSWRILTLAGSRTKVEIFTTQAQDQPVVMQDEGYRAELLPVSSFCSCPMVNHLSNVAVDIFLTSISYKIFFLSNGCTYVQAYIERACWINSIKSVGRVSWSPTSYYHNNSLKIRFVLAAFIQWPVYIYRLVKSNGCTLPLRF